jgi:hypothetical protein
MHSEGVPDRIDEFTRNRDAIARFAKRYQDSCQSCCSVGQMSPSMSLPALLTAIRELSRWRCQYSLRSLFVLATGSAIAVWLVVPSFRANQFVSAIKSGDFRHAESMFHEPDDGFPRPWVTDRQASLSELALYPLTVKDLWRGERHLHIYSPCDPDTEVLSFDLHISIRVTGWSVETGLVWH